MRLEFDVYEMNEENRVFKEMKKLGGNDVNNEFLIVGDKVIEGQEYFTCINLTKDGVKILGGLKLDALSFSVIKSDLKIKRNNEISSISTVLDIPRRYLTMDLVENILRLNP